MTRWAQPISGASSTRSCSWKNIEWENVELNVHRLQMRIAKAIREIVMAKQNHCNGY